MFYPKISTEMLIPFTVVIENVKKNPEYLNHPDCPFSDEIKRFFSQFQVASVADIFEGNDEVLVIEEQIQRIINDLEKMAPNIINSEPTEKLNYFKTKTSLFEKLITMKEKVVNIKEINEFRNSIIGFLDEICDKDQITKLMERLDG